MINYEITQERQKYFIAGIDSHIGKALRNYLLHKGHKIVGSTRRKEILTGDITFLDLSKNILGWNPPDGCSTGIISAAVTSLDACQINPNQSFQINVTGTVNLAKKILDAGMHLIFLSTNWVFDGSVPFQKTCDPVCPKIMYGIEKAEAEKAILKLGDNVTIVRLTKILTPKSSLISGWTNALVNGEAIYPFTDMKLAPITMDFAVACLGAIIKTPYSGIVHVSGDKDITYEQVARYIAQSINADEDLIQPVPSGMCPIFVPENTTLDASDLTYSYGLYPQDVWQTIDGVMR